MFLDVWLNVVIALCCKYGAFLCCRYFPLSVEVNYTAVKYIKIVEETVPWSLLAAQCTVLVSGQNQDVSGLPVVLHGLMHQNQARESKHTLTHSFVFSSETQFFYNIVC